MISKLSKIQRQLAGNVSSQWWIINSRTNSTANVLVLIHIIIMSFLWHLLLLYFSIIIYNRRQFQYYPINTRNRYGGNLFNDLLGRCCRSVELVRLSAHHVGKRWKTFGHVCPSCSNAPTWARLAWRWCAMCIETADFNVERKSLSRHRRPTTTTWLWLLIVMKTSVCSAPVLAASQRQWKTANITILFGMYYHNHRTNQAQANG